MLSCEDTLHATREIHRMTSAVTLSRVHSSEVKAGLGVSGLALLLRELN